MIGYPSAVLDLLLCRLEATQRQVRILKKKQNYEYWPTYSVYIWIGKFCLVVKSYFYVQNWQYTTSLILPGGKTSPLSKSRMPPFDSHKLRHTVIALGLIPDSQIRHEIGDGQEPCTVLYAQSRKRKLFDLLCSWLMTDPERTDSLGKAAYVSFTFTCWKKSKWTMEK